MIVSMLLPVVRIHVSILHNHLPGSYLACSIGVIL